MTSSLLRVLSVILLPLFIVQSSAQTYDEGSEFGPIAQSSVGALGRIREDNLNCFLQLDRSLADKWTLLLDPEPSIENRNKEPGNTRLAEDRRVLIDDLGYCMRNMTRKLNNTAISECMNDLVASELENDGVISLPELFEDSLPLPFLTFLDFADLKKLLKLDGDSRIYKVAREYLAKENSEGDRVFVIDQSCEWKNLDALKNRESKGSGEMLAEFRQQVVRSLSVQIAHALFEAKDLRPGTWITVYRRWSVVRLENLKELDSVINGLKTQRFTIDQLCKYATVLATNFADYELKVLLPKRASPLRLATAELRERSEAAESLRCGSGPGTKSCSDFRALKKSFDEDLSCLKTFGELLSNHVIHSIVEKYVNFEPPIRYPEIVCKKITPLETIAVRYCRCVGSFCSSYHVGDINANTYRLDNGSLVLTGF